MTNANTKGKKRLVEAERLHREALAVRQKLYGRAAPLPLYGARTEGRELSESLLEVARVVHKQWRLGDAEDVYRQAFQTRRKAAGDGHPDTAAARCALAGCLGDQGRVEEAAAEYKRALEVLVRAKGEGHPEVVDVVSKLAVCMCLRGRWVRAGVCGNGVGMGLLAGACSAGGRRVSWQVCAGWGGGRRALWKCRPQAGAWPLRGTFSGSGASDGKRRWQVSHSPEKHQFIVRNSRAVNVPALARPQVCV